MSTLRSKLRAEPGLNSRQPESAFLLRGPEPWERSGRGRSFYNLGDPSLKLRAQVWLSKWGYGHTCAVYR